MSDRTTAGVTNVTQRCRDYDQQHLVRACQRIRNGSHCSSTAENSSSFFGCFTVIKLMTLQCNSVSTVTELLARRSGFDPLQEWGVGLFLQSSILIHGVMLN